MEQYKRVRLYFPVLSRGIPNLVKHQEKKQERGYLKCRIRILMFLSLNSSSGSVGLEKNKPAFLAHFHEEGNTYVV